jgi:uncharacterized protein (DUF433 family)
MAPPVSPIGTAICVDRPPTAIVEHIKESEMTLAERITVDPAVMGGRPCVRGLRVSVGTVVGLVAAGRSNAEILSLYPYLEPDDIRAALEYAAWRVDELERPFTTRTA